MFKTILGRLFFTICSVFLCAYLYAIDPSIVSLLFLVFGLFLLLDISRYWSKRIALEKEEGTHSPLSKTPMILKDFFCSKEKVKRLSRKGRMSRIFFYLGLIVVVVPASLIGSIPQEKRHELFQDFKLATLGIYYAETGNDEELVTLLQNLTEEGHVDAQFRLALLYHNGLAGPPNKRIALELFSSAAENGHARAKIALGDIYMEGDGVSSDCQKASSYFKCAMEEGDTLAQLKLARIHLKGLCGPPNYKLAYELLIPLAEAGNPHAQFAIGRMYQQGDGVSKDMNKAEMWIKRAAKNGSQAAANILNETVSK